MYLDSKILSLITVSSFMTANMIDLKPDISRKRATENDPLVFVLVDMSMVGFLIRYCLECLVR